MTLEQLIAGLVGSALGLRALDSSKPIWARAAYAAVGFDMLKTAFTMDGSPEPLFGPRGAQRTGLVRDPSKLPRFEERKARTITERVSHVHEQAVKGTRDPAIYKFARDVLSRKCGRDWCLPQGTTILTPQGLCPIEHLEVGDMVLGDGEWTAVKAWYATGRKAITNFTLDNGLVLRCTDEHRLFKVPRRNKRRPGKRGDEVEVRARDVKVGDELLQLGSVPFGSIHLDPDEAVLMGAYVSEGWLEPSRVSIAGVPNSKGIRERVIVAAKRLGLKWTADDFKVRIMDKKLVARLRQECGELAPNKHLPHTNYDRPTVEVLVSMLNADARSPERSNVKTPTFMSTSVVLVQQYRLLYRMLGHSSSVHLLPAQGPMQAPVFQVHVRQTNKAKGRRYWAKVQSIEWTAPEEVFDIETASQRVYLPDADVVVHNCVKEKDALGEITAIFNEVKSRVRYTWDPTDYDAFQTPEKTLELKTGDCIPEDALVVTAGYKLKPIGEVVEGDVVMGNGRWTKVSKFWEKGKKKLLAFDLNNGCVLRCTKDHRVFVVAKDGTVHERRAGQVRVGEMLLSPSKLPEGREALGVDRAWLLGVYIADGWAEDYRCSISGKDGHPKEAQKRRVQAIAEKEGAPTRWHPKYIAINASPLAQWLMSGTGRGAANKQVPSLDMDAVSRDALLEGLQADAAHEGPARNIVYGTISKTLALQLRLLHRQRGESVSMRYVTKHGGLGDNPIWRVTVRQSNRKPHPKVKAIRELPAVRVVDIETDAHEFYLPEADVIVHNCDDYNSLLAASLRTVGYKVRSRVVQTQGEPTWNHIYLLVKVPTTGQWMPLDLSVRQPAGWEVPKNLIVKVQDFDIVEKGSTLSLPN